jgi:hypothetical protein
MFNKDNISPEQKQFAVFCLEIYRTRKNITGKEAIALFEKTGLLDYIIDCYDQLHSFGAEYLMSDFDEFVKNHEEN